MITHVRTSTVVSLALALSFVLTGCEGASPDKAGLKYSEDLYDGCVQCHGEDGEGNQKLGSPAIAGPRALVHQVTTSQVQEEPARVAHR